MSKTEINKVIIEIRKYLLNKYDTVKLLEDCLKNEEFSNWVCTPEFLEEYLTLSNSNTLKTKDNTWIDALRLSVEYINTPIPNLSNITDRISNSYDEDRFVKIEEEIAISYGEKIESPEGIDEEYILKFFRYYYLPGKIFVFFFVDDGFTPDIDVSGALIGSTKYGIETITFYDDLFKNKEISDKKLDKWVSSNFGAYMYIPGAITYKGNFREDSSLELDL